MIRVPVSLGELFDKIAILQIKAERIREPNRLSSVHTELNLLLDVAKRLDLPSAASGLTDELRAVNEALWDIEDKIRAKERTKTFDEEFVALARDVYKTNDRRADLKRKINILLGSELREEKSYSEY